MTPAIEGKARHAGDYAIILLSMLAFGLFYVFYQPDSFRALDFIDPDDALRLVEVRDWMGGQSWFDVSQHRINPPAGGQMHWWRLLDVPIAACIWLFGLFIAPAQAEHIALIVWPLLLYGLFLLMLRAVLQQLGGRALCWTGLLIPVTMIFVTRQFAPLRIDHHGWQIVAATALLALALGARSGTKGALAGLVMAFYLSISLEALPYFLLFGGLFAFSYWRGADGWPMLRGFLLACTFATVLSVPASRGWQALTVSYCDGLSAPYLGALVAGSIAMLLAGRIIGHASAVRRLILLSVTGLAALAAFLLVAPQCSRGPFGQLDPLVHDYWYLNVKEGLPLTAQTLDMALYSLIPTIIGLIGSTLAWRSSRGAARVNWSLLLTLQIGAGIISCLVMRAMYVSHAFAVPGVAFTLLMIWHWARRLEPAPLRILASTAVVLALPPVPMAAVAKMQSALADEPTEKTEMRVSACFRSANIDRLNAVPKAVLFAPIDIGPSILTDTGHSVIATGHHRNQAEIKAVMQAFMGDAALARSVVTRSRADLLLFCPDTAEMDVYIKVAPNGLAARLIKGDIPAWLRPLPHHGASPIRLYRIDRTAPSSPGSGR